MESPIDEGCLSLHNEILTVFSQLLSKNEFSLIHSDSLGVDSRNLLIYEDHFKLKFVEDRGGLEILIGSKKAPNSWEDKSGNRRFWFHSWGVINWIAGKPKLSQEELNAQNKAAFFQDSRQRLEEEVLSINKHADKIDQIFSESRINESEIALQTYIYE